MRCFPHEKDSTQNYSKKKTEELSLRQFLSELSESVRQVEEIGRGTTRLLEVRLLSVQEPCGGCDFGRAPCSGSMM